MPLMQPAYGGGTWLRPASGPAELDAVIVHDHDRVHAPPEPWLTVPNVLRVLRRRVGLILLGTFVLSLLGITLTILLPPSYRAETLIVVDARRPQISNVPDVMSQLPAEQVVLRSEVDALGSNNLL